MNSKRVWTRREFGQAAAAAAGVALATRSGVAGLAAHSTARYAFVGSEQPGVPWSGTLHAFRTAGTEWTPVATVPAAAPAHLLAHPTLPVLYVVHNVGEWEHLPRGAVSAYRFDRQREQMVPLGNQPLSLSATHPRHAVLTAGATHLFVPAEGGGIYNLLPVAADGTLRPASAIHKAFGLDEDGIQKTASPNTVALLPDGSLLAADAGSETLTHFTHSGDHLAARYRTRVHREQGPSCLALSPDGRYAYTVGNELHAVRRYELRNGKALDTAELIHEAPNHVSLAVAPEGDVICLGGKETSSLFRIDRTQDDFAESWWIRDLAGEVRFSPGGDALVALDPRTGEIRQAAFHAGNCKVGVAKTVAHVRGGTRLLLA